MRGQAGSPQKRMKTRLVAAWTPKRDTIDLVSLFGWFSSVPRPVFAEGRKGANARRPASPGPIGPGPWGPRPKNPAAGAGQGQTEMGLAARLPAGLGPSAVGPLAPRPRRPSRPEAVPPGRGGLHDPGLEEAFARRFLPEPGGHGHRSRVRQGVTWPQWNSRDSLGQGARQGPGSCRAEKGRRRG